jgi:DNA-directed RNA polymerase specialized sigma24 family protein
LAHATVLRQSVKTPCSFGHSVCVSRVTAAEGVLAGASSPSADAADAEAVRRSLTDPVAFTAVFDRHFVAVHRYLHRRGGRDLADELAGETFRVAFEARARWSQTTPDARPWLLGIATNLLRRHRRTEERRFSPAEPSGTGAASPALSANTPRASARSSVRDVSAEHPLPPDELMQRVGRIEELNLHAAYEAIGRHSTG